MINEEFLNLILSSQSEHDDVNKDNLRFLTAWDAMGKRCYEKMLDMIFRDVFDSIEKDMAKETVVDMSNIFHISCAYYQHLDIHNKKII
jgi:hypothetical protein